MRSWDEVLCSIIIESRLWIVAALFSEVERVQYLPVKKLGRQCGCRYGRDHAAETVGPVEFGPPLFSYSVNK